MDINQTSIQAMPVSSALPPATGSNKLNVGKAERILSVVAGLALSYAAVRNIRKPSGKYLGLAGVMLLKRGVTGHCEVNQLLNRDTAHAKSSAMEIKSVLTINKPRSEVFSFWSNFENLPRFMEHLKEVEVLDERRSSWTAILPGGVGQVSWESVIEEEVQDEVITWSSLPGSTIDNAGEIRFADSKWQGQTEVIAKISYRLPAGSIGSAAGKLFNPLVERMIKNDLLRFKTFLETGVVPPNSSTRSRKKKALNY